MGPDAGGTWHKLGEVAGSALTALLIFAAVPAVLIIVVGDPLSGGLGHQWHHLERTAFAVLTASTWVSWVACSTQLLRSVVLHVRRGEVGLPLGAPLTERIAARIAVGVLALTTMGTPLVLASGSGAGAAVPARSHAGAPPARPVETEPSRHDAVTRSAPSYRVRPGDSLWTIADAQLGDGGDWTAIAALNLGRSMPGGHRLVDPNQVLAGWTLQMPTGSAPASMASDVTALSEHREHRPPDLPELLIIGIGSIGCAALARRARRQRVLRRYDRRHPEDPFEPTGSAVDTDILLSRFERVPALTAFESANCLLGRALGAMAGSTVTPSVRAICVGSTGVTFWLARPGQAAPPGFTPDEDGRSWHVGHEHLDGHDPYCPYLPVVLPIGDDEQGTWLVPLGPGTTLPVLGEAADAWWRAARPVQEAWAWADLVVVTDDPQEAAHCVAGPAAGRGYAPSVSPVLFAGDPRALPPGLADRMAVVTTSPVAATDVAVLVDRQGASIHPLARTVRPHLMSVGTARQVDEVLRPPGTGALAAGPPTDERPARPTPVSGHRALRPEPGAVEVKLLTATPRIDGLREPLPPNRSRRAVELVAYLALHRPDEVTSDRLRTRVLGSSDADAASKTLFNTATAARRSMGGDADGNPLFPTGTRNGHYRVSDEVAVDVQRAAALASLGNAEEDTQMAMAYLRAALELVEGEPLANALSGYSWWEVEGHAGQIAAVLVNAACNLAALAVEAGLFALAQQGLRKARLVDPYSEALSRAAMQVAAAEGDADALRREWRECQRRVDEVDPGSSPSPRTERLYGELSRQVPVGAGGGSD
jgi:DNA-binding SARP family transcriptional activator